MIKRFFSAATFAMFMFGTASAADLGGKVLKVGSDTTYPVCPHKVVQFEC